MYMYMYWWWLGKKGGRKGVYEKRKEKKVRRKYIKEGRKGRKEGQKYIKEGRTNGRKDGQKEGREYRCRPTLLISKSSSSVLCGLSPYSDTRAVNCLEVRGSFASRIFSKTCASPGQTVSR